MIKKLTMNVVAVKYIALDTYEMTLKNDYICQHAEPGQFLHIAVPGHTLRRPISISSIYRERGIAKIIFKTVGEGTEQLTRFQAGDVLDVLGPSGNGYPIDSELKSALLVGGGVGVPPLYFLAQTLYEQGITVQSILGFQTKDAVFYENEFKQFGPTYIVTDDGSHGHKGLVTDMIPNVANYERYYSCGPLPMLRAVKETLQSTDGYLSFEERMGCGVGTCFACVIPMNTSEKYGKICQDGPVFRAKEVII